MNVSSKQTITLQFGNFSNFVGSHYWNQLEASNNEPSNLYRTDTSATGARRSSPRVLVFDIRFEYRIVVSMFVFVFLFLMYCLWAL